MNPGLVGRAHELELLADLAGRARAGTPVVALVEGEEGMGKSTLLNRAVEVVDGATVLRASGGEDEMELSYGVLSQLAASGRGVAGGVGATTPRDGAGALSAGADLLSMLGDLQEGDRLVLLLVDDLQWADLPSARALLFALRRLVADRVLTLLSARADELGRLGEGWPRFVAGDHRVVRVPLGGLGPEELVELCRASGAGELTRRAAVRLVGDTGGNPLYCCTLLQELGSGIVDDRGRVRRVPRRLADVVVRRLRSLDADARGLVAASAVLGQHAPLGVAGALAGLDDPLPALERASAARLLAEEEPTGRVSIPHALVRQAVYEDLRPTVRRRLHQRAARLVAPEHRLGHRVAAAVPPDDRLADDLDSAAVDASRHHRGAQAAAWFARAAALSGSSPARDRRLLDALEILVASGDVAGAEDLTPDVAVLGPSPRRQGLLGALDLFAGRCRDAEVRLADAWATHDPAGEPLVGAAAAAELLQLCFVSGRMPEAVEWGERAAATSAGDPPLHRRVLAGLSRALYLDGREEEGLALLAGPPDAPAELPAGELDALVIASFTRLWAGDLERAASDLATCAAHLRAGTPSRYPSQCLSCLADAQYRLGQWDDASVHANLSVALARDADRVWDFPFVHGYAAVVPAERGEWELAAHHVAEAREAAGAVAAVAVAATAACRLAAAQGDPDGVLRAAGPLRATGRADACGYPGWLAWRPLEVEALIGLGELGRAACALDDLERTVSRAAPAAVRVDLARLRAALADALGEEAAAAEALRAARRAACGLGQPRCTAELELAEARHLRLAGDRAQAVACVRAARARLVALGARPHVARCDHELASCGVPVATDASPAFLGLTPAEQAVARLVVDGRTNRQTSSELYVSVKTVEFHLRNIFTKLEVRSRGELAERLRFLQEPPSPETGVGARARPW